MWGQEPDPLPNPTNQTQSSQYYLEPGNYILKSDMKLNDAARYNIGNKSGHRNGNYTINLNGHTLDASNVKGRSIFNMGSGTLTIIDEPIDGSVPDGKVINSSATCVYVGPSTGYTATFNMHGGTIENCRPSDGEGGAVEVEQNSNSEKAFFNMYGGTIVGCKASQGAGVYVEGGVFNMYGGTITGNKIFSLQDSANSGWQSHSGEDDKLPDGINSYKWYDGGSSLKNDHREYRGGGVYVEKGTFNMHGGTISENVSVNGGGVYVISGATFNLYGGSIVNNYAASEGFDFGNGGGVFLSNNSKFVIDGTKSDNDIVIRGNKVTRYGGGIYVDNSTLTVTNATIADNFASSGAGVAQYGSAGITLNQCTISTNHALVQGEATVDVGGGGVFSNSTGGLTISGSQIIGNTSTKYGAGIYLGGGTFTVKSANSISGNKAINGGGVYMANGTFSVDQSGVLTADNNGANYGGVIYMAGGTVNVYGAFNAGQNGSNTATEFGGAIYMNNGNITFSSASFLNNTAKSGGAIYMGSGNFTVNGTATLNSNKATSGDGGGVYLGGGTFKVASNGTVNLGAAGSGNSASGNGGGLYCAGAFTVDGKAMVSYNSAKNGGGVCVSNGSVSLAAGKGSIISYNTAVDLGGGLYVVNSGTRRAASFQGGTFNANVANSGGAVSAVGPVDLSLAATMEGNTARNGNGGGIYMAGGVSMTFGDGLIRANSALQGSSNTQEYTTASGKDASSVAGVGGGIFMGASTSLSFNSTEMGIYNNAATNAGADICANGNNTTINLPNISNMNLKGFDVPGNALYWVEDHFTGESYTGSNGGSMKGVRYEDALMNPEIEIVDYIVPFEEGVKSKPIANKYICLDLGYDLVFVTLQASGLEHENTAIITMSYPKKDAEGNPTSESVQYRKVLIMGNGSRIVGLPSGDWKFAATDWDFKYQEPTFDPVHGSNGYIYIERSKNDEILIHFELKENIDNLIYENIKFHEAKKVNRLRL